MKEQTTMKTIYNNIKLGLSTLKTIVHFANAGILLIPAMVISCTCAFACGLWLIGCLGTVLVVPSICYICYSVAAGIKHKLPEAGLYPFIRKKFNSNDEFMKAIEGKSHRELDALNFMCW